MTQPLRVLIVEDDERDAALVLHELRRCDYEVTYERVDTPEAMGAAISCSWPKAENRPALNTRTVSRECSTSIGRFCACAGKAASMLQIAMTKTKMNEGLFLAKETFPSTRP